MKKVIITFVFCALCFSGYQCYKAGCFNAGGHIHHNDVIK